MKAILSLSLSDGTDLADKVNPRFVSLSLSEARENEADELELTLHNHDRALAIPETGVTLNLALGWDAAADEDMGTAQPGLVDKGQFKVDEVGESGPPDIVTIKARSADMTGLFRQLRTKSWKNTTLGTVLNEIAARHGHSVKVGGDLAGRAIDVIEQDGKSDMAFVRDLGRRYDAIATRKGGVLIFTPIGAGTSASGEALDSITLTKRDGWSWKFNQADRESYDGAEAQWQDSDAGRRKTVTTGGENRRKLKRVYASEAEAKQAAEAATTRAARKPYAFTYDLAIADPALQPDMKVTLQGWSERIDAIQWLIVSVRTEHGAGGMKQSIEMESA